MEEDMNEFVRAGQIVRTGYLADPELHQLMHEACALMMLPIYEGFGLPVAQARSIGLPVITTLGSSLPEACEWQGIFVDAWDETSVSAGIAQALLKKRTSSPEVKSWMDYTRGLLELIHKGKGELSLPPAPHIQAEY